MTTLFLQLTEMLVAQAEGGESGPGSFLDGMGGMLPLVLMFAVIYFLMIRPASKQRKQHAQMLNQLKRDDEVVTNGGIYGKVISLEDKVVTLEVADRVKIRILRDRIAGKWNPQSTSAPQ